MALTSVVSVEQQKPDWRGENPKYNDQEYQENYKIVSETSDEIKNNTAKGNRSKSCHLHTHL